MNIINNSMHKQIVLASSSKSRSKILKNAGIHFFQINPLCDEEAIKKRIKSKKNKPKQYVKKLSFEKAKSISVLKKFKKETVVGCDTIIIYNKKIFDKANNMTEAKNKIKLLSGKKHKIISALTICENGKKIWQCEETTHVKIRKMNSKQISTYLNKTGKKILDSVGCYQIESFGPTIIENIDGDFFNVMGLPLFKLINYLLKNK